MFEKMVGMGSMGFCLLGRGGKSGEDEVMWGRLGVGVYCDFWIIVVVDGEWG